MRLNFSTVLAVLAVNEKKQLLLLINTGYNELRKCLIDKLTFFFIVELTGFDTTGDDDDADDDCASKSPHGLFHSILKVSSNSTF